MNLAKLIDGLIPLVGGVAISLLAFRVVGKKPGQDARMDHWHQKYGRWFKIGGPVLIGITLLRLVLEGNLGSAP